LVIKDGRFDKNEQKLFKEMFGGEMLDKLTRYLSGIDPNSVKTSVEDNVQKSQKELHSAIPGSYEDELQQIHNQVNTHFTSSHTS